MPAPRTPRWTAAEIAVLREHYPAGGFEAVQAHLPERSWHAIHVKANKLGLRTSHRAEGRKVKLAGVDLEEAIRLREEENWSYARIGAKFGVAECAASNAVLIALCPRKGFTPAERTPYGRLSEAGLERVRYALKKGLKAVDIQLRLGVSAACVAEQRRRYNADLKARGKALLPPPGAGETYSGVRVAKSVIARIEALYLEGYGSHRITVRTGASKTTCHRVRARLIRRLKRLGQCLPGCDSDGIRRVQVAHCRNIGPAQIAALNAMLLDRLPVQRAAKLAAIGLCSAYRLRDELAAQLAARGESLPSPILPGRARHRTRAEDPHWPPASREDIFEFRALLADMDFDEAKAHWRRTRSEAQRAEAARPKSFEEQLARVAAGQIGIVPALPRAHLEPHQMAR